MVVENVLKKLKAFDLMVMVSIFIFGNLEVCLIKILVLLQDLTI